VLFPGKNKGAGGQVLAPWRNKKGISFLEGWLEFVSLHSRRENAGGDRTLTGQF